MPYLAHIKQLSQSWRTLRHLTDWMQVGTDPWRWKRLQSGDDGKAERKERHNRTNVTFIEYQPNIAPRKTAITSAEKLKETLGSLTHDGTGASPLRLFVVEDLSQQVIELLGSRFDVDPLFFREQIGDNVWHNTRDPWAMPPTLISSTKQRSWFRLRNLRLRYHTSDESYKSAVKQANTWNVSRRPDNDNNHWNYKDEKGSIVTLLRTRTTIWTGKDTRCGNGTVGIILLDPTIKEGTPLWYDRTNWLPTTGMGQGPPPVVDLSKSWYEDVIQMTTAYPWFEVVSGHKIEPQVLTCPTLFTVCAEWLVVCDYINTRLSQVEWELEMPEVFRSKGDMIESSLRRLATWRRWVPVLREMVTEAMEQGIPAAARLTALASEHNAEADVFKDIKSDYDRVLRLLQESQDRIGRLSDHLNAEISIENANQSLDENHSVARLSWLATIFVPASFISGLFSMTDDLAALQTTYKRYFAVALPVTALIMLFVWFLNSKYKKAIDDKRKDKNLKTRADIAAGNLKS